MKTEIAAACLLAAVLVLVESRNLPEDLNQDTVEHRERRAVETIHHRVRRRVAYAWVNESAVTVLLQIDTRKHATSCGKDCTYAVRYAAVGKGDIEKAKWKLVAFGDMGLVYLTKSNDLIDPTEECLINTIGPDCSRINTITCQFKPPQRANNVPLAVVDKPDDEEQTEATTPADTDTTDDEGTQGETNDTDPVVRRKRAADAKKQHQDWAKDNQMCKTGKPVEGQNALDIIASDPILRSVCQIGKQ